MVEIIKFELGEKNPLIVYLLFSQAGHGVNFGIDSVIPIGVKL